MARAATPSSRSGSTSVFVDLASIICGAFLLSLGEELGGRLPMRYRLQPTAGAPEEPGKKAETPTKVGADAAATPPFAARRVTRTMLQVRDRRVRGTVP